MGPPPKIVASIVTFNRKRAVVDCLHAVAAQTTGVQEAIVIDNGSSDGTEEAIAESGVAERLPILFLRLERNAGADIRTLVAEGADMHPREAVQHLVQAVLRETGGTLKDDATVLCLDWHGGPVRERTTSSGADG